ncbi:hypothetical protein HDU98_000332 [Podochytrium sp. JEL0797]|nr:hypothetical protein HDU98_000332 [Podochytrium sp. JEL0797]
MLLRSRLLAAFKILLGLSTALVLGGYTLITANRHLPVSASITHIITKPLLCDTYLDTSGMLHPNGDWRLLDNGTRMAQRQGCKVAPFFNPWDPSFGNDTALPSHLQNKLILLFGDSFERMTVERFCQLPGSELRTGELNGDVFPVGNHAYASDMQVCSLRRSGKVLVLLYVPHFGVFQGQKDKPDQNHYHENWSHVEIEKRIPWLPNMLASFASEMYPELCPNSKCPIQSPLRVKDDWYGRAEMVDTPRLLKSGNFWSPATPFWFPVPDLLVAQSSTWDVFHENVYKNETNWEIQTEFLKSWSRLMTSKLLEPLQENFASYLPSVKVKSESGIDSTVAEYPRMLVRTAPLCSYDRNKCLPSTSRYMNNIIRSGVLWEDSVGGKDAWGVADYDGLVSGLGSWLGDQMHPGEWAMQAQTVWYLSRLQLMAQGVPINP